MRLVPAVNDPVVEELQAVLAELAKGPVIDSTDELVTSEPTVETELFDSDVADSATQDEDTEEVQRADVSPEQILEAIVLPDDADVEAISLDDDLELIDEIEPIEVESVVAEPVASETPAAAIEPSETPVFTLQSKDSAPGDAPATGTTAAQDSDGAGFAPVDDELAKTLSRENRNRQKIQGGAAGASAPSAAPPAISKAVYTQPSEKKEAPTPATETSQGPSGPQDASGGSSATIVTFVAIAAVVALILWAAMDGNYRKTAPDSQAPAAKQAPSNGVNKGKPATSQGAEAKATVAANKGPQASSGASASGESGKADAPGTNEAATNPAVIAIAADVQDSEGEATDRDVTASADDAGTAIAAAEAEPDAGTTSDSNGDSGAADAAVVVESGVDKVPDAGGSSDTSDGGSVAAESKASKRGEPIQTRINPKEWGCPAGMTQVYRKMKIEHEGEKVPGFEIHCVDRREAGGPTRNISLYGAISACERRGARLCSVKNGAVRVVESTPTVGALEDKCNTLSLDGYLSPIHPSGYSRSAAPCGSLRHGK